MAMPSADRECVGETQASWMLRGVLDYLTGPSLVSPRYLHLSFSPMSTFFVSALASIWHASVSAGIDIKAIVLAPTLARAHDHHRS
eukprot:2217223-Rhodomonas_salina.1